MISKLPKMLSGFNPQRFQRLPVLGDRELLVLEVLWSRGEATAHGVLGEMPDQCISLSTVQSTLERLHRKQLLNRVKQGRAYHYRAALDRSHLICGLLREMSEQVAAGDLAPMLSGFVNYVSVESPQLANDLTALLVDRPETTQQREKVDE